MSATSLFTHNKRKAYVDGQYPLVSVELGGPRVGHGPPYVENSLLFKFFLRKSRYMLLFPLLIFDRRTVAQQSAMCEIDSWHVFEQSESTFADFFFFAKS